LLHVADMNCSQNTHAENTMRVRVLMYWS